MAESVCLDFSKLSFSVASGDDQTVFTVPRTQYSCPDQKFQGFSPAINQLCDELTHDESTHDGSVLWCYMDN
jgi:hypothetical protein